MKVLRGVQQFLCDYESSLSYFLTQMSLYTAVAYRNYYDIAVACSDSRMGRHKAATRRGN